jgi:thiol:disulfide interchange protein
VSSKVLLVLTICLTSIALFYCRQKSAEETSTTELGYRDYLKSSNFVYIHGETADSALLGDDKYIEDNLDYVLKNHPWVLVNFSAYWCKDCRKFDPDFRAVSQLPEYQDIMFAYAEVDGTKGNENFRTRFNLPGVPVTILFHSGQIPQSNGQLAILFGQRGDQTKSDLLALLNAFYQS